MYNLRKGVMRFMAASGPLKKFDLIDKCDVTRNLWHMSKKPNPSDVEKCLHSHKSSLNYSFECGSKFMHTKAERELVEMLTDEILAERKAQKVKAVPTTLEGFCIKLDGGDVTLTKQTDKEKIIINFNVNHSIDVEDESDVNDAAEKADVCEMRSKPRFEINLVKGDTTLSLACSYLEDKPQDDECNDIFGIEEMAIFQGERNDKIYAVAGDVLDGYLYDLLMYLLEEKGISNEFVKKMSDIATMYEHCAYIGMLESISKFITGNYDTKIVKETCAS